MKKLIFFFSFFITFSTIGFSQIDSILVIEHDLDDELEADVKLLKKESLTLANGVPKIDVVLQPQERDIIVYQLLPGWTSDHKNTAQVSVRISVTNKEAESIIWEKIVIKYKENGANKSKTFFPEQPISISASKTKTWQNSRGYHQEGEVLYINSTLPTSLTIELYFKNFSAPVKVTKKLAPYQESFGLPFKDSDLDEDEVWYSSSTHGGGSQVFAYDMVVVGYSNNKWSRKLPGKDGSQNNHHRVYGKPIYAIADGVVVRFTNDMIENPKPGERAPDTGGGGNSFVIRHGNIQALYAHMQKGSLNPSLLREGAIIKKGDFLGKAGNSGKSSGPHLHIHISNDGNFRPFLFDEGFTIGAEYYSKPFATEKWSELKKIGIPGFASKRSFISPSKNHPFGDVLIEHKDGTRGSFIGVWEGKKENEFVIMGAEWGAFTKRWAKLSKEKKVRLIDLDVVNVNGTFRYNGIFKDGTGKYALYQFDSWDKFTKKWSDLNKENLRLIDIETFVSNNKRFYIGVWVEGTDKYAFYQFDSWEKFTQKWSDLNKENLRLIDVETFAAGGKRYYTGVWQEGTDKYAFYQFDSWDKFTDKWGELNKDGLRLIDIETFKSGDKNYYIGVWREGSGAYGLYLYHNWQQFNMKRKELAAKNCQLIDIEQVILN